MLDLVSLDRDASGVGVVGVLSIYGILNVMSENGIDLYRAASVLGYSLLPMVILSSLTALLHLEYTLKPNQNRGWIAFVFSCI